MEEVFEKLAEALVILSEDKNNPHFTRELAALMRRRFPARALEVSRISNKGRFKAREEAQDPLSPGNTWVHPSLRQPDETARDVAFPADVTPAPKAPAVTAKKKHVAEEGSQKSDGVDLLALAVMGEDEIRERFTLAELKKALADQGVPMPRNANWALVLPAINEYLQNL